MPQTVPIPPTGRLRRPVLSLTANGAAEREVGRWARGMAYLGGHGRRVFDNALEALLFPVSWSPNEIAPIPEGGQP